jgi:tRNA dimethylallyltransferase
MIIIAGPTAVGKTAVAIDLAQRFQTSIISADSRQCFHEMNIGVARPSPAELQTIPHHFIASHSINEKVNAVVFEKYALEAAAKIFESNRVVVVTGGTGLYIKELTEGLDDIPEIPPAIREQIIINYNRNGLSWLQTEVKKKDPEFFASGETENPQRLMRALEVMQATKRSVLRFRKGAKVKRNFTIIKIALELPRELLYQRINARVDQMVKMGLTEEVKVLLPFKDLNALQTVGYREIIDQLEGKHSLETAIDLIKKNTRHYAKRQLTWFRKDPGFIWLPPDNQIVFDTVNQLMDQYS